jgi:hypothetical protein
MERKNRIHNSLGTEKQNTLRFWNGSGTEKNNTQWSWNITDKIFTHSVLI